MKNITLATFETDVLAASATTPVLVDFWAPWCGPCKTLGPILEDLESEYAGRFLLAKIDSDQEQQLSAAFGIRSVPTCVLMMNGKPVDGFSGALPKVQIKAFLDQHLPLVEVLQSEEPPLSDDPETLLNQYAQVVEKDPANEHARFDWIVQLLKLQRLDSARKAFSPVLDQAAGSPLFSAIKQWLDAIELAANQQNIENHKTQLTQSIATDKRDFNARYELAQLLMAQQNWVQAMDELLEILMRDKNWNHEAARVAMVNILQLITPRPVKVADGQIPPQDPLVQSYRRRLSSIVLS